MNLPTKLTVFARSCLIWPSLPLLRQSWYEFLLATSSYKFQVVSEYLSPSVVLETAVAPSPDSVQSRKQSATSSYKFQVASIFPRFWFTSLLLRPHMTHSSPESIARSGKNLMQSVSASSLFSLLLFTPVHPPPPSSCPWI